MTSNPTKFSRREGFIYLLAALLLLLALWPPGAAYSQSGFLAGFSGEESLVAQVRASAHWLHTVLRPAPQLAPEAVDHQYSGPPAGINTFLQNEALPEVRAQSVELISEAGFGVIRQHFPWEDIEIHAKGDFVDRRNDPDGVDAWAKYDNIVALAEANELEVLARIDNPPSWSRALSDEEIGTHAPPDDIRDYGDFVAAVVERYAGRIHYVQLWNEPNVFPEWGNQPVSAEAYTALLCEGYQRAKVANPDIVVVAAALSPTVELYWRDMSHLVFLQRMYAAGAGDCFDVMSAQGYGLFSGATDYRLRPTVVNFPSHLLLRDVMVTNGDAHKPLWISEMGWNVAPENVPANFGRVTPEEQARYAVEAYDRIANEWPWIEVANYWYFKQVDERNIEQPVYYFRLMDPDFTPQPVYAALSQHLTTNQTVSPRPAWWYTWQQLRRWLGLLGGGVLFFGLLRLCTPQLSQEVD